MFSAAIKCSRQKNKKQNQKKNQKKNQTYNLHPYYVLIHLFMNHHRASW